jgi:hypothetical protein
VLPQKLDWTVETYNLDLSASPIFYLILYNDESNDTSSADSYNTSAYFNITEAESSPSTSTGTATLAAATASGSHPVPTVTITPTSLASGSNSDGQKAGLSTGAKAGIGVGVGISALAAIICASALFFYMRRNKRQNTQAQPTESVSPVEPPIYPSYPPSELPTQNYELPKPENRVVSELYTPDTFQPPKSPQMQSVV